MGDLFSTEKVAQEKKPLKRLHGYHISTGLTLYGLKGTGSVHWRTLLKRVSVISMILLTATFSWFAAGSHLPLLKEFRANPGSLSISRMRVIASAVFKRI
jgi:hypothetical protein